MVSKYFILMVLMFIRRILFLIKYGTHKLIIVKQSQQKLAEIKMWHNFFFAITIFLYNTFCRIWKPETWKTKTNDTYNMPFDILYIHENTKIFGLIITVTHCHDCDIEYRTYVNRKWLHPKLPSLIFKWGLFRENNGEYIYYKTDWNRVCIIVSRVAHVTFCLLALTFPFFFYIFLRTYAHKDKGQVFCHFLTSSKQEVTRISCVSFIQNAINLMKFSPQNISLPWCILKGL